MKNLILVALCVFLIANLAQAKKLATTTSNNSKFDVRVPVKNWIKKNNKHFRVSVGTGSLATNFRFRSSGNLGNTIEGSDNNTNSNNLNLNLGYEKMIKKNIGYSTFFTYQNSEIELSSGKDEFRNFRLSGNATYRLSKQASVYGGLNYGAWFGSQEIEDAFDAGIGYQAGISLVLHKKATLEMEYLTLLNEGKLSGYNLNLESKGIMLKMKMPLAFNI
jgi:opacity protein-like surface antigen